MITMYNFKEGINCLINRFPLLKFSELKRWLKDVLKDTELAMKIAEVVEEEKNDQDRTQRIKELMGERLSQCKNANLP